MKGKRSQNPFCLYFAQLQRLRLFNRKSGPGFSAKATRLYPQSSALASAFQLPLSSRIASSAISFRLPSASISAAASADSPLPSAFASGLSGPSIQRLSPLP
ncbi:MAG: hypothetical protein IJ381_05345, partial [Clostridia bacterium]|nr:hypothetical protein [Clostridia bacterium]